MLCLVVFGGLFFHIVLHLVCSLPVRVKWVFFIHPPTMAIKIPGLCLGIYGLFVSSLFKQSLDVCNLFSFQYRFSISPVFVCNPSLIIISSCSIFFRAFPQLPAFLFLQSNALSVNIRMIRISDFARCVDLSDLPSPRPSLLRLPRIFLLFATVPFTLTNKRWRYAPAQGDQR